MRGVTAAVIADNGLVCHADAHGKTRWIESSVMGRSVHFSVQHAEFDEFATVVPVTHGGHTTVVVHHH